MKAGFKSVILRWEVTYLIWYSVLQTSASASCISSEHGSHSWWQGDSADVLLSVTNYTQSTDSQTIRMLNVALNHSYLMGNLTLPEEVKTVELLMKNQIQHFESNLLKTATQKWRPLTLLPLCFYSQRKWPQLAFSFLQNQTQTFKTNHKIFKSVQ